MKKLEKASQIRGTKYIHVFAPCPVGWGMPSDEMVTSAREVVDCGLWYLAEYEAGKYTLNRNPKEFASIPEYLAKQSRFRHLTEEDIALMTESRDQKWEELRRQCGLAT